MEIRTATPADAEAILDIYSYYILQTAITFEYSVPSVEEFRGRMVKTLEKYPYLVAVEDSRILGYAYAGPFVGRAAYDWSAETTIYLLPEAKGLGIGRALYEALEAALGKMGILNLYACIGETEAEDEYLSHQSAEFHAHLGYRECGRFRRCGYKFGRWYDMIWMEKTIGEHKDVQPAVKSYSEVQE